MKCDIATISKALMTVVALGITGGIVDMTAAEEYVRDRCAICCEQDTLYDCINKGIC